MFSARFTFVCATLLLPTSMLLAQKAKTTAALPVQAVTTASAGMTNDDVIGLATAGLGDNVIIAKIKKAPSTNFDTSVTALKALKTAGVSSAVIQVMVDPTAAPASAAAPAYAAAPANDPDDPQSPHSGIFIQSKGPDGKMHLQKLLMTTSSGSKGPSFGSSLGTAYSFGLHKSKIKFVIPGTKAELSVKDASPVFWIYPGDMSITNIQLMPLEVKKDSREATGASFGLVGMSSGSASNAHEQLSVEKVKDGVYKVTEASPLTSGSYAFVQGAGGSYYDFDIITP